MHNVKPFTLRAPYGVSQTLYNQVEELILISPNGLPNEGEKHLMPSQNPIPELRKLKRFTWVFWTEDLSHEWKYTREHHLYDIGDACLVKKLLPLAHSIIKIPKFMEVTIVNAGSVQDLERPLSTSAEKEDRMKTALIQAMLLTSNSGVDSRDEEKNISSIDRALGQFQNIKFLSMKAYLETQNWQDIWQPEEVRSWLQQ
ncbi:uncharacterized protein L201_001836 [Kwoniella dendrophila CBS 6074]|uniref:Uncharacterized protein n=1 Tax=Kwoniella dendrophila CBS 6074 TaxID=1295534 RepID=A0AAX4JQV8_9TREE